MPSGLYGDQITGVDGVSRLGVFVGHPLQDRFADEGMDGDPFLFGENDQFRVQFAWKINGPLPLWCGYIFSSGASWTVANGHLLLVPLGEAGSKAIKYAAYLIYTSS